MLKIFSVCFRKKQHKEVTESFSHKMKNNFSLNSDKKNEILFVKAKAIIISFAKRMKPKE